MKSAVIRVKLPGAFILPPSERLLTALSPSARLLIFFSWA